MNNRVILLFIAFTFICICNINKAFAQCSSSTGSVLFFEDFGGNNTTDNVTGTSLNLKGSTGLPYSANPKSGSYMIKKWVTNGDWLPNDDHTYWGDKNRGYFMVIDPQPTFLNKVIYELELTGISCTNIPLLFTCWTANLNYQLTPPKIELRIVNAGGTTLASTGNITIPTRTSFAWAENTLNFTSTGGTLKFQIICKDGNTSGNDLALDDIGVYLCTNKVYTTANGSSDKNISSCVGAAVDFAGTYVNDGKFSTNLKSQWLYSTTGEVSSLAGWTVIDTKDVGGTTAVGATYRHDFTYANAKTGFYRLVVGRRTDNLTNTFCRAASDVFHLSSTLPAPVLTQPANQNVCAGSNTVAVNFSGTNVTASTCLWTNSNTAIGLGVSGKGNIPSFVAKNTTNAPITSTISVTPVSASGCTGTTKTFTITVNPTPILAQPGSQTICAGSSTTAVNFAGTNVNAATCTWINNNTAIGLIASGTGNIPSFVAKNTTNAAITATITVTPKSASGCTAATKTFTITVNPTPILTQPGSQTVCAGSSTAAVNFAGTNINAATCTWTNNNTAIGLATNGTGNIASFVAKNTTNTAITATITVTPKSASGCTAATKTFTITVNPTPILTQPGSQTVCAGSSTAAVNFAGTNINAATCTWTNNNTAIGLATNGTGNIASFVAKNTTNAAITATITVTPKSASGCAAATKTFTITVNPTATITTNLVNTTYCDGANVPAITLTGSVSGTTFAWTNNNTAIGLAVKGNGNIPAFVATNTGTTPITATIMVTPTANNCTGTSKSFTITVRPRVVVGNITGNPYTCLNEKPQTIKGVKTTGGSGTFTYQWQSSPNGSSGWTDISGATDANYSPGILSQDTYFRRISKDVTCGDYFSSNFKISIMPDNVSFEWLQNPVDNNWNNPANWSNSKGLSGAVPTKCSNVRIGSTQKIPSLDTNNTAVSQYGEPTTDNIIFNYEGQLAYPHNLKYNKAFVRYNWGFYTTDGPSEVTGLHNGDPMSNTTLSRNKLYMLSAPLKKMTPGDFSLAGYPFTWQQDFVLHTTPKVGGAISGDFSKPFATNDIDLSTRNHAIVVKVAGGGSSTGYNNHSNLEGLKGVMEVPYFENTGVAAFHPGHSYDKISQTSSFLYYNAKTLQLLGSPIGKLKRASEAYRFVYEKDDNSTPVIQSLSNVKGYTLSVSTKVAGGAVMIGNPYMASINMKNFIDANSNIDNTKGYYVFEGNTDTWKQFSYTTTNNIGPLQAFIVTLKSTISKTDLYFPLEGSYALTGPNFKGSSRIAPGSKSILVTIGDGVNNGDKESRSYAILGTANEFENDVQKILYPESKASELYFISRSEDKVGNMVQVITPDMDGVDIGVRSFGISGIQLLQFDNVKEFVNTTGKYPILIDNQLKIEQDLLSNPIYRFTQRKLNTIDGVDENRFSLRFSHEQNTGEGLSVIYYKDGTLKVSSVKEIKQIQIYDLNGRLLNELILNSATTFFREFIPLANGIYLVKVKTVDDKNMTKKIQSSLY